jgi:4-carboxymuconolactone decarboxylase
MDDDRLRAANELRRTVLGAAYVDNASLGDDDTAAELQDHIVAMAWGAWARGGPLSTRDRSLLTMAMTAALGRMEEFRLHVRSAGRAGVTDAEIDELVFQIAGYCGAPAAIAARRGILEERAARDGES